MTTMKGKMISMQLASLRWREDGENGGIDDCVDFDYRVDRMRLWNEKDTSVNSNQSGIPQITLSSCQYTYFSRFTYD